MWIIIQGIPLSTTQKELNQFLNKQISCKGWFRFSSKAEIRLKTISILRMTDRASGDIECHGLAELETEKPEEEALRLLNGHQLGGRTIPVRKYYHRASRAVQRDKQRSGRTPLDQIERRRPSLHIEMLKANAGDFSARLF